MSQAPINEILRTLLVEDSELDAALIVRRLEKSGQQVQWQRVDTENDMRAALEKQAWDVVISDYRMPQLDAPGALAVLQQSRLDIPFIVVSGMIGEETAVMMMRMGAKDYMMKDNLSRLAPAVIREVGDARARCRARETEDRVRHLMETQASILNALRTPIALISTEGTIVGVNEAWHHFATAGGLLDPQSTIGTNYLDVCDRAQGDGSQQAREAAAGIRRLLAGEVTEFACEYPCHSPAEQRWFRMVATPLDEHESSGVVVMHINITERKRAEDSLRESEAHFRQAAAFNERLVQEVNHRVRNNLSALLSVISLTRKTSADVPSFSAAMEDRVRSLARIHNLMRQGMDLGKMINLCGMTHPGGRFSGRISIEGPQVYLGSAQILPLATSMVELFNNSVKYGAFSTPTGRVWIRWTVEKSPKGKMISLRWQETGGPMICGPVKRSLGTELINGFVTYDLNGNCNLNYPAEGVDHLLEFLAVEVNNAPNAG
jgi:two-component sensor histidine kinase/DNA-binding NarL/FixJ family response regulator